MDGPASPGLSEQEIIELVGRLAGGGGAGLSTGIGDDAAVLSLPGGDYVVTTDMMVEGVHFKLGWGGAAALGRRALATNLSDLAAMGALPRWGFLSLGLPGPPGADFVTELLQGMIGLGRQAGLTLAGGDTVAAPQIIINLCLIGAMEEVKPLLRAGASAGQAVCVTGRLGDSAAGLAWLLKGGDPEQAGLEPLLRAHLEPAARLAAGRAIAASGLATAMMDLSDGLASDLARLCQASGIGALVSDDLLPISQQARHLAARLGGDVLDWALTGGEDYELLLTCPAQHVPELARLVEAAQPGLGLTQVGRTVAAAGVLLQDRTGRSRAIDFKGFDHFRKD